MPRNVFAVYTFDERYLYLNFLRIFSALLVCLSHSKEFFFNHMGSNPSFIEKIFRLNFSLGHESVLVFFFLSGYLVGGNEIIYFLNNSLRPLKYLFDRFTRLWSVLIPALVITFLINISICSNSKDSLYCTASFKLASRTASSPLDSQSVLDFFSNLFFLQPFRNSQFGANGPLWSLSFEFWYYMIFYYVLILVKSFFTKNLLKPVILLLPLFLIGISIVSREWFLLGLIWLFGSVSRFLILKMDKREFFDFCSANIYGKFLFSTMLVLLPLMYLSKYSPVFLPFLMTFLTFIIGFMSPRKVERKNFFVDNAIVTGSKFSFSLYLIHFPVLALFAHYLVPSSRWEFSVYNVLKLSLPVSACLIAAFTLAFFTEFKLEKLRLKLSIFYPVFK